MFQIDGWSDAARHPAPPRPHILCYLHAPELGGVERAAARLIRAWQPHARVTVALVCGEEGRLGAEGARLVRPGWRVPAWLARIWLLVWLPILVRRERPDILFCAGNTYSLAAIVARRVLGRRCPPIVVKVSNPLDRADLSPFRRAVAAWWARVQGRYVTWFVATSAAMAAEIADVAACAPSRIVFIPNPAFDAAVFAALAAVPPAPVGRTGRHFVAAGRLAAQKDFGLLLAAFARGARADDRLTILGEGPQRRALAAAVDALGLAGQVRMPGFAAAVAPWLEAANAFILSSRYEGLPAAVLEAMAAGRPVIATDCCVAMRPLLEEGGGGTLVPPGDVAALAAAIAAFAPDGSDPVHARAIAARHVTDRVAAAYLPLFHAARVAAQ